MSDDIRYESASFVAPAPNLPMVAPLPIDAQQVVRDGMKANGAMIDGLLRSIQPPPPPADGVIGTYSTPSESRERTSRYKFSLGAIVTICMSIAGGIVLLAYRSGAVDGPAGVAMWLTLFGILAAAFVTWLQTLDMHHSPEGIAHAREQYHAVVDQADADSRKVLADAYAYAIRTDADAKAHTTHSQAAALDAHTQSLLLRAPAPSPRRVTVAGSATPQPWHWEQGEDGTPVPVPDGAETPPLPLLPSSYPPLSPPIPTGVDPVAGVVLGWVASLYDDPDALDPITRRIKVKLPWGAQSTMLAPVDKDRIKAIMLDMQPPLFVPLPGNALALPCQFKGVALQRVREALG